MDQAHRISKDTGATVNHTINKFTFVYKWALDYPWDHDLGTKLLHENLIYKQSLLFISLINLDILVDSTKIKANNIDKFEGQAVTPISLLACQGNHLAVKLLLDRGASVQNAIAGYKAGGYFNDTAKTEELISSFSHNKKMCEILLNEAKKTDLVIEPLIPKHNIRSYK